MDAADRIIEEFDRLVSLGNDGVAKRPTSERILYYVVITRCTKDIGGFATVYEQELTAAELVVLIQGLEDIDEHELAGEFRRGFELLEQSGFYEHMNWTMVPDSVATEIEAIGKRVGDRLWNLDEKLAALLDNPGRH